MIKSRNLYENSFIPWSTLKVAMNRRNKRLALISLVLAMAVVVVVVIFVPPYLEMSTVNHFASQIYTAVSDDDGWAGSNVYYTYYNNSHYATTSSINELNSYTPTPYLTSSEIAILNNYTQVSPSTFQNYLKKAGNTMGQATDYGRSMFLLNITRVENVFYMQYVSHDNVGFPSINARCVIYF